MGERQTCDFGGLTLDLTSGRASLSGERQEADFSSFRRFNARPKQIGRAWASVNRASVSSRWAGPASLKTSSPRGRSWYS